MQSVPAAEDCPRGRPPRRAAATRALGAVVVLAIGAGFALAPGCGSDARVETARSAAATAGAEPAPSAPVEAPEDGRALIEELECNRCHAEVGAVEAAPGKHCFSCHARIADGSFEASAALLAEWRPRVAPLRHAPSLGGVGPLVRPSWVEGYLVRPFDVRPALHADMPRLPLDAGRARAIVRALSDRNLAAHPLRDPLEPGDVDRGRALFEPKGCAGCHAFSGARTPLPSPARATDGPDKTLAPDLRFARERLVREAVAPWILDPTRLKPGAAMPKQAVTPAEARDLAAFILDVPLDAAVAPRPFARLPPLTRPVGYDEVAERVLHKVCWHCHSQPDFARGDGGPGNTGGFGFAPRKLDLSTYEAILTGYVDDRGERTSLFARGPTGEPTLVAALVARHGEVRGSVGPVRGMPLGLPPLSPEDVQLVESWVAQGHRR